MMNKKKIFLLAAVLSICLLTTIVDAGSYPFDKDKVVNQDPAVFTTVTASSSTGRLKIEGLSTTAFGSGAWCYVGEKIIPNGNYKMKIGCTATLSYRLSAGFGSGTIKVSYVLCDADMDELDSHEVFRRDVGWFGTYSGSKSFTFTTTYTMDGGYTMQSGETYYVCVKLFAAVAFSAGVHSSTGTGPMNLAVTNIAWIYY